ncbi:hypothetical protein [Kitasatospora acidiphila]|uniref:hypothetical protein n=1 Tax=Kitasatospora acidiphila TaxID=2567942 RepID=UPI003C715C54
MAFTLVSSAVMTHPRRLEQAERIAAELGLDAVVVDPAPADAPSALRTAIAAWASVRPGASHHLVVQDDLAGPAGLTELVRRSAARHPDEALAFYTHWNSRNGAAVRLAALAGASWVRAVPEEFTPTLAVSLPTATADEFGRHAVASADRHDDEVLSQVLRRTGRMSLLAVPNLVQHVGTASLTGHDVSQGLRRAACLVDAPEVAGWLESGPVLDTVDGLPYLRLGHAHLRVDALAAEPQRRGHSLWWEALPHLGIEPDRVLQLVDERRPVALGAEVSRLFGAAFATELWIHCLLVGLQAPRLARPAEGGFDALGRRLRAAAVATIGIAGLPPESRATVTAGQVSLLTRYAWSAIRLGPLLRAHTGTATGQ